MMRLTAEALWFVLPALIANQCPGLAARLNWPGNTPISERWLGRNKTLAAYYTAILGAVLTIYLQRLFRGFSAPVNLLDYTRWDLWFVGILFGLGAVAGDHAKSFLKRQIGIPPGGRWWPFDQLDFIAGSLLATMPVVGWIGWPRAAIIAAVMLVIHPLGNWVGHQIGLRKVPW